MRVCSCSVLLLLSLSLLASGIAQPNQVRPCEVPAARQFDFWVGTWDLAWGEEGRGTNTIRRILDDCIIEENFEGMTANGLFTGKSVTAYRPATGQWLQTWVDNEGGYLDFAGSMQDDRMILQREGVKDEQPVLQRMVWYHITDDALDWNWEQSEDGGETWTVLWKIHYTRRK